MKWRAKHTLCSYTCIMDSLVLEMAQKVVESVDNITTRLYVIVIIQDEYDILVITRVRGKVSGDIYLLS